MKTVTRFIPLAILVSVGVSCVSVDKKAQHSGNLQWNELSDSAVQTARNQQRPVLIAFEANWCAVSRNNRKVLSSREAEQVLASSHAKLFMHDCSTLDPDTKAMMARYGARNLPSYLIYRPGSDAPIVVGAPLTPQSLAMTLKKSDSR